MPGALRPGPRDSRHSDWPGLGLAATPADVCPQLTVLTQGETEIRMTAIHSRRQTRGMPGVFSCPAEPLTWLLYATGEWRFPDSASGKVRLPGQRTATLGQPHLGSHGAGEPDSILGEEAAAMERELQRRYHLGEGTANAWSHELAHSKLSRARSVPSLSVYSLNQLGDHSLFSE